MSKQSPQAKAAKARKEATAAAKKKAVETAFTEAVETTVAETPAKRGDDDVTLEFSSTYLEGTEGNKASLRRYTVSDEQITFIMQQANSNDYAVELAKLGRDLGNMQWKLALHCVVVAYRMQRDGKEALPFANEFFQAMTKLGTEYTMVRTNAIKAWLLDFAALEWDTKEKCFAFSGKNRSKWHTAFSKSDKGKKNFIVARMRVPFWVHEPEKEPVKFVLADYLTTALKRAENVAKADDSLYEKKDLEGLEDFRKFVAKLNKAHNHHDGINEETNETEEETETKAA